MKQIINGADLRRMIISAAAAIEINKQALNDLNVFPVPDGDTGTNMSMTINAAAGDLRKTEDPDLAKAAKVAASAMLRGARGNSGVILSLLFRGVADALKGKENADGVLWAEALQRGVDAAYKAVMKPAEGTILTVARLAAAKAQEAARENNHIEFVHEAAIAEAKIALADTVNQNPVLKKAGVVDAGGKGWLVALEAMLASLQGNDVIVPEGAAGETKEAASFDDFDTDDITFTYCTEFIIQRENDNDPEKLREFLSSLGDSLVLVDDEEIIKVHVHTNDPGKALHEAIDYGSFVTVKIENMRLQHTEKVMSEKELAPKIAEPEKPLGVVSVCAGEGLADVFMNLGVDQIISGGQTMNPSTQDILEAVNKVPAETVFILPNNKNIIMAAEQVAGLTPKQIVVIPSKTVPQGVTAMLGFNPEGSVEENTEALTEALGTVDTMQITYAARNSDFDGYDIHEGDYLALYGSQLFGTSQDIKVLLKSLAEKVRDDGKEYVTIYYGADVKEKHAQKAADLFADICPNADVNLLSGGQPVYYYLISAE
ncbi:MAG: DAK2 domain-containing protein [Oscillospiraceae bacterium]|nr:DAK2 domain-containing protein [Oscillospiraceae bacterium]